MELHTQFHTPVECHFQFELDLLSDLNQSNYNKKYKIMPHKNHNNYIEKMYATLKKKINVILVID